MRTIQIQAGSVTMEAELLDTPTADAIYEALPFTGSANVWGDEIYFSIPVSMDQEADAEEEMAVGDLAYWPMGTAFCIFFGPTPVSRAGEPRAYSPVNRFGRIIGNARLFKTVGSGESVTVDKTATDG